MRPTARWSIVAALVAACRVYDPDLVARREAGAGDAIGADVPTDIAPVDAPADATDAADAGADAPPDVATPCAPVLAAGRPCIEPFSGHAWSADDPRLVAPQGVAFVPGTPARLLVSDVGTGRVMAYNATDGMAPRRVAGTGVLGAPTGSGMGPAQPLHAPSALATLPSGDVVVADPVERALFVIRSAGTLERYGAMVFTDGPHAVQFIPAENALLVAADNRIYRADVSAGDPTLFTPIVGQACGTSCRGLNAMPAPGLMSQLNGPTGIDFDANYIYIADSANCRIRRAARNAPMDRAFETTVFAGSPTGCDRDSDVLVAGRPGATQVDALLARLGPVGDVRVGYDGTVYFTDPVARCAVLAVPTTGPNANQLRVLVGSPRRCGEIGAGNVRLGHLGGLTLSTDRRVLFFVDRQAHRVGRVQLDAPGGPTAPTLIEPGAVPGMDTVDRVRVGGVAGLAVAGSPDAPVVFWSGAAEGRVYRFEPARGVSVFAGAGRERLTTPIPASQLEPGAGALGFGSDRLVIALRAHHAIAGAMGSSMFRVVGTYDTPGVPAMMGGAATNPVAFPVAPVVANNNLFFGVEAPTPRVYRVDGVMPTNPISLVAGIGPGPDGGAPDGGVMVPPDGSAPAASVAIGRPAGLAVDAAGTVYIADPDNNVVWRVRAGGLLDVAAGVRGMSTLSPDTETPANAVSLMAPVALAHDGANTLYIADAAALRVRALNLTTRTVTTVAGSGPAAPNGANSAGDFADAARAVLARPTALAYIGRRLYVGEGNTGRVRVVRVP